MKSKQSGSSLIEVLVAMLVLSIGIFGMMSLQTASLRNSQSANQRSIAAISSHAILDAMRANRTVALNNGYNFAITPECTRPAGTTQADIDITIWLDNLQNELGGSACGNINCLPDDTCTVLVRWSDERATADTQDFTIQIQTQAQL